MRQEVSPIIDRGLDPFSPYWDERLGEKWKEPKESAKSLTALVLATQDTPEGPVAIYGLPIAVEDEKEPQP